MHRLSPKFIADLKTGILQELLNQVIADKDLDLHIRENYLNIYYKGNSLLKLTGCANSYRVEIDAKFLGDLTLDSIYDEVTASIFVAAIPRLKAARRFLARN